ncbi:MAG: glycosyltransferase family 39 protein [Chloroflexota bacterium]|nr:glycosyltransferase family 39 protein [Chloroflexota bacterium]
MLHIALLLITAVAAVLRCYCIDRLPPGLHYDEAFNNLLALRLPHWDPFPVFFFDVEFGRCVLHPYLIALLFQATGPILLGGRLVSAVAGTLTVPLLFFTAWEMFRDDTEERQAQRLGIASALSLTGLYWHVHLSRIGMEYAMVPILAVPAFGAIWRALRRQRFWGAVTAGVILGLTPYTYPPALFVPLLLALFFGCRIIFERGFLRANWRILAIVMCVALLVIAPMGHFFVTHPQWFTLRASQVVGGDLLEGILKIVRGIFIQGDLNPRQNLPGRPALDSIQATLFILGMGTCLARRRPPHLFLLCWMGVMSLPSVLTEYPPHFGRMLGAAPAAAMLVGLGAVTFYDLILKAAARLFPQARRVVSTVAVLLLVFAFALSGVYTARDYFIVWGQSDDLFIAFDVGLRWIGEYVAALPQEEQVYISPTDRFWKTLEFLQGGDPYRTHNYNGRRCVVYPAVTEVPTSHVVIVLEDPNSLPVIQAAFPDGRVVQELYMGNTPYSVVYRTPAGRTAQISLTHPLEVNFDGQVRLLGYDPPTGPFAPGDTIPLRLYWLGQAQMTDWYKVFVHLWGTPSPAEGGHIWGQEDVHPCDNSYPTPWWAAGDVVADEYRIPISPDTPPGEYQLVVGLYLEDGPRLPVLDAAGRSTGDHVVVTTVQVVAP